jgi:hypothetical protein
VIRVARRVSAASAVIPATSMKASRPDAENVQRDLGALAVQTRCAGVDVSAFRVLTVLGPSVARIPALELTPDLGVVALPEASQIAGDLHGAAVRREQV